jgi:hypothetical protein
MNTPREHFWVRMMKGRRQLVALGAGYVSPLFASAAAPANFKEFIELILKILQGVLAISFGLMSFAVLFAVVVFLANMENEKTREQIKGYLLWAVIGLAVSMSLWGILAVLKGTFFGGGSGIIQITPPS